jgi:mannose-1-phosphate guanylyltransferase
MTQKTRDIDQAVVLAAGYGTRARPLTLVRPKPLFFAAGRTLLDRVLDRLAAAGVRRAAVNTHHLADRIRRHLDASDRDLTVETVFEPEILGTGGGIKNAAKVLEPGHLLVVNADVYSEIDLSALVRAHRASGGAATLAVHDCPAFNQVAVGPDGLIRGFRGSGVSQGAELAAFTGVQVLGPEVLNAIGESPADLIAAYQRLIDAGRPVAAHRVDGAVWHDAGTLSGYLDLNQDLLDRRPQGPVMIDPKARVAPTARLEGFVWVGPGAVVEAGARVRDSLIWPNGRVAAGARLNRVVAAGAASGTVTGAAVVG